MKRKLPLLLIVTILALVSINIGCGKKEYSKEEIYEDFQKQISKIDGYTCVSNVIAVNEKTDTMYVFKETYSKSKYYKIEVKSPKELEGKIIEYRPNTVKIMNKSNNDIVELNNRRSKEKYFFIGSFIDNCNETKSANLQMEKEQLKIEINIPGEDEYFNKQILYINSRTKTPEKMEILDHNGEAIFLVSYENFKYSK